MLNFRDRLPPVKVEYFAKAIIPACTKISNLILWYVIIMKTSCHGNVASWPHHRVLPLMNYLEYINHRAAYLGIIRTMSPQKCLFSARDPSPYLINGSLEPRESITQDANWLVQPISQGSPQRPTDRPRYSVCSNRSHSCVMHAMRDNRA